MKTSNYKTFKIQAFIDVNVFIFIQHYFCSPYEMPLKVCSRLYSYITLGMPQLRKDLLQKLH